VEYIEVRCTAPSDAEDRLSELVACSSSLGSQLVDDGRGGVSMSVFFKGRARRDAERLAAVLERAGAAGVVVQEYPDRDWMAPYRRLARPFNLGRRWWIDPRPDRSTRAPESRIRLVIEPGQAFGSGSHPSTRLVLLELEDIDVGGRRVLDVGTGSGILAFAATALGAGLVVAFDVDLQAGWEAHRNLGRQEMATPPLLLVARIDAIAGCSFDLILCNMLSERARALLPAIASRMARGGRLVLSGMVDEESERMVAELERHGFEIECLRRLEGWTGVRAVCNGGS
jgi:ribosomal protein L11 methyltransferase